MYYWAETLFQLRYFNKLFAFIAFTNSTNINYAVNFRYVTLWQMKMLTFYTISKDVMINKWSEKFALHCYSLFINLIAQVILFYYTKRLKLQELSLFHHLLQILCNPLLSFLYKFNCSNNFTRYFIYFIMRRQYLQVTAVLSVVVSIPTRLQAVIDPGTSL